MKQKLTYFLITIFWITFFMITTAFGESLHRNHITGNEYNMVAYGQVFIDGADFSAEEMFFLSFGPGGEQDCRSRSKIGKDGSFYATIAGHKEDEIIVFKVEDGKGNTYDLTKSITFKADATLEKLMIR